MMKRYEVVRGADEHNLKKISIILGYEEHPYWSCSSQNPSRPSRVEAEISGRVADLSMDGDNARCGYIFRGQEPVAVKGRVGIAGTRGTR